MIRFADKDTTPLVRSMWKVCFGDNDEYIDLIFSYKYKEKNTLIYVDNGVVAASLQIQEYPMRMYGEVIPVYYLAGLCTLPQYRSKGFMGELIIKSFEVMRQRKIPLCILVPANDRLYDYYSKYGFVQTFEKGIKPINLAPILSKHPNSTEEAYKCFDKEYQQSDFTLLKTYEDFESIAKEYTADGSPIKYNLGGISYLLDPSAILELYARKNTTKNFTIKIGIEESQIQEKYKITDGKVEIYQGSNIDFEVEKKLLTKLLFGYKTHELSPLFSANFEENQPILNLMLE